MRIASARGRLTAVGKPGKAGYNLPRISIYCACAVQPIHR